MERFKTVVLSTPPASATAPVMLPGQLEQARRRAAVDNGIELPGDLLATIRRLAGQAS
jgi:LDH2 family malate/lactate/ureidoglycolate dehydrogenase